MLRAAIAGQNIQVWDRLVYPRRRDTSSRSRGTGPTRIGTMVAATMSGDIPLIDDEPADSALHHAELLGTQDVALKADNDQGVPINSVIDSYVQLETSVVDKAPKTSDTKAIVVCS